MNNNSKNDLKILENKAQKYLDGILETVKQKSKFLDGNLFYVNMSEAENKVPSEELRVKRENFLFLTRNVENILEIGFNAGHSALIALLANNKSKLTIVDTCDHIYTEEAFKYLSDKFPNRLKLLKGNSTNILPQIKDKFDLIHFDGGKDKTIRKDLEICKVLVNDEHVLIIDDTQNEKLLTIVNEKINNNFIEKDKYSILSKRSESFKWKHLISTYVDEDTFEVTKKILNNLQKIYDNESFNSIYTNSKDVRKVSGFSRAHSLIELVKKTKYLKGDFVECGVAAGHSSVIAAFALQHYEKPETNIYMYDTYEGFCFSLKNELDFQGKSIKDYDLSRYETHHTSEQSVFEKMSKTNWPKEKLKMYKGVVEKTIPKNVPDSISILRLDMDLYEPTKHALEHLYPLIDIGGYLIIDDYGHWDGCKKAVDEFFSDNNLNIDDLIYVDYTCRVYKKREMKTLKGSLGGAWDERTHLKLHAKNFNKGMADFIVNKIKPKDFLEFGSGLGFLAKHLDDNLELKHSYCIEPNNIEGLYNEMMNVEFLQLNIFNDQIPEKINKTFHLVMSIEVAEHIEREQHDELFDFLVNHTSNWIIFSGARIGQGGHGHIAEREEEDWKSEFISRGMVFAEDYTMSIREACDQKNINHRRNVMVFYKPNTLNTIKRFLFGK